MFERKVTAVGQLCWEKHIPDLDIPHFKDKVLLSIETLFEAITGIPEREGRRGKGRGERE